MYDRKHAELKLVTDQLAQIDAASPGLDLSGEDASELVQRAVEAVVTLAGELARVSSDSAQSAEMSRTLSASIAALDQTLPTLRDAAQSIKSREEALAATAERLVASVSRLEARQAELLSEAQNKLRSFATLAFWAVLFSACAVAGVGVTLFVLLDHLK